MRIALFLLIAVSASPQTTAEKVKQGHSHYGKAFDEGPRAKPWEMRDIGSAPFPITHKNPEVQKWFNQGHTLLHLFWEYEAERAFRWALKLEPDNAMVFWGLARATSGDRARDFLRQAIKRKHTVSERERLYIEALENSMLDPLRDRSDDDQRSNREYTKALESIAVKYPDDVEAKSLLALATMGDSRVGSDLLARQVLAKAPDHPGAHHYRIHNWNYHEPEQALDSCKRFGEIAPGSGHALHMPGHVYATVGMWHEAAISMDAATRVEKRIMNESLTFPFNHWNYGHNRNYLCYIQEQLGMAEKAIFGARQLIDAPLDPKQNSDNGFSGHSQGIAAMLRAHIKFERWKELLDSRTIPWRDVFVDKMNKAYAEFRVHLALGDAIKAEDAMKSHADLKKDLEKNKRFEKSYEIQSLELKARLALARGETLQGLGVLSEAASKQFDMQIRDNDPPVYPEVLYTALGRAYLDANAPDLAIQAYRKALELTRNDIFALSGLVESYHRAGKRADAEKTMSSLLFIAADADQGLAVVERAKATGVTAEPKDNSPKPQRRYASLDLDKYGPAVWEPFPAPRLDVRDTADKPVSLEDYKGKNVLLVFYLGRECVHCMSQLQAIQGKKSEWDRLGVAVIAVSSNTPEANREVLKDSQYSAIGFLSDKDFQNARRFRSYDDFEEMELHSTILIDRQGRVHWGITGGEPFSDTAFLIKQFERMNRKSESQN